MLVAIDRALPPTVGVYLDCSVPVLRHLALTVWLRHIPPIIILTLTQFLYTYPLTLNNQVGQPALCLNGLQHLIDGNSSSKMDHCILSFFVWRGRVTHVTVSDGRVKRDE